MSPCKICGFAKGGAIEGERYCSSCESNLSITLTPKQQAERRSKKMKRTECGVHSRWALPYWFNQKAGV